MKTALNQNLYDSFKVVVEENLQQGMPTLQKSQFKDLTSVIRNQKKELMKPKVSKGNVEDNEIENRKTVEKNKLNQSWCFEKIQLN